MSLKDNTNTVLYDFYKSTGDLKKTIEVCRGMLESNKSTPEIRGEICEVVLVVMLEDYIAKNKLDKEGWFISKSLILKDLENPLSNYLTELDVTLFTPKKVYLFECKSYRGDKRFIKECTLVLKNRKNNKSFDVYSQHIKHYKALYKYLVKFRKKVDTIHKPYRIACFNFSQGTTEDERNSKFRNLFPVLDDSNLYELFSSYDSEPDQWDINYVRRVVNILDDSKEAFTGTHLNYVSSLHSGNRL